MLMGPCGEYHGSNVNKIKTIMKKHMENHQHGEPGKMDPARMNHENPAHSGHNPGHGSMGHDHHRMMIEDFKKRFWVTLVLTVPILLLSPMIQGFFGYEFTFPGSLYVLFALSSVVYFYGGWPFIKGFWEEGRQG